MELEEYMGPVCDWPMWLRDVVSCTHLTHPKRLTVCTVLGMATRHALIDLWDKDDRLALHGIGHEPHERLSMRMEAVQEAGHVGDRRARAER